MEYSDWIRWAFGASLRACFAWMLVAGGGCGAQAWSLKDYKSPSFFLKDASTLEFGYENKGCLQLPGGVSATVDGAAMTIADNGGSTTTHDEGTNADPIPTWTSGCNPPTFKAAQAPPAEGKTTYKVTDGQTTWTMIVENLMAQRQTEMVTPPSRGGAVTVHPGDEVEVRCDPLGGKITGVRFGDPNHPPSFHIEAARLNALGDNSFRFTVPADSDSVPPAGQSAVGLFECEETVGVSCTGDIGCDDPIAPPSVTSMTMTVTSPG